MLIEKFKKKKSFCPYVQGIVDGHSVIRDLRASESFTSNYFFLELLLEGNRNCTSRTRFFSVFSFFPLFLLNIVAFPRHLLARRGEVTKCTLHSSVYTDPTIYRTSYQVSSAGIGHTVWHLESGSDMASVPGAPVVYLMGHGGESSSHLV